MNARQRFAFERPQATAGGMADDFREIRRTPQLVTILTVNR